MNNNMIKLIVKREKSYNRKKWRLITFAVIILSFIFTSIISLSLNDINNFNKICPYHLMITNINKNIYNQINEKRKVFRINELGMYADLGISTDNKVKIIYADSVGMKGNGFKIVKGTLPRLSNEIALYGQENINIGDKINLTYIDSYDNKKINKQFKVTAILKCEMYGKEKDEGILVSPEYASNIIGDSNRNSLYINFNTENKEEMTLERENLKNEYNLDGKQVFSNDKYINGILGDSNQIIILLFLGLICCILCKSIIYTIYNIFYNEKLVYFKKLKLVGMTKSDFFKMNKFETREVFINVIWGQILSLILLISYMKLKISLIITISCLIYISVVIYAAINFATKKQLKELLDEDNLNKSKLEYIVKNLKTIKKNKTSKLSIKDLSNRNNKVYKSRNTLIKKSIIFTSIIFIIFATVFTSVDYDKRMSQIYRYNEQYLIYPDMHNIYKQIDTFQKRNILNDNFINKIKSIQGVREVIVNKSVLVDIKDEKGNKFNEVAGFNNDKLQKRLNYYLEDGQITNDKVIVNRWRMKKTGLNFKVGSKIYIKELNKSNFSSYVVGGIVNDRNSTELLYLPNKFNTINNSNYSLSIITTNGKSSDLVVNKINKILQNYPQLKLRNYYVQLNDTKSVFSKILFVLLIIVGLLFILSIVNTINIVNIDLMSRDREFALFEVNGMTRSCLKKQLFIEYGSIAAVTILVIFIFSYLLSFIIYKVAEIFLGIAFLRFAYSYISFVVVSLITLIIIFLVVMRRVKNQDTNLSNRLK